VLALAIGVLAQPATLARLLNGIDSVAVSHGFSGVIMVGETDGDMDFARAYGMADRERQIPNRVDTKFVTASVAQTFTAVAVARLAQDGKIALDAPLSRYLPDSVYPRDRADHMTIRQLLTHTAGLGPGVVRLPQFRAAPQSFTSLDQIVALIRAQPLVGDTGHFAYSGADCDLLGAVIEHVSGKPFADYVRDRVFLPMNMTSSGFDFSNRPANLAHVDEAMLPRIGLPEAVAYTNARDLYLFAGSLLRHPLPGLLTDTVTTGQPGPNHAYGYGFFVGMAGRNRIVNHGGTGPGIDNAFDLYPDLDFFVIILSNQDPPAAQNIRQYLRDGLASLPRHK
jgi:CubicO group peptidase (beta-lactamase class C family)